MYIHSSTHQLSLSLSVYIQQHKSTSRRHPAHPTHVTPLSISLYTQCEKSVVASSAAVAAVLEYIERGCAPPLGSAKMERMFDDELAQPATRYIDTRTHCRRVALLLLLLLMAKHLNKRRYIYTSYTLQTRLL